MRTDVHLGELRDRVRREVQNRPGIYRIVGGAGVVVYVGKSKRLRTRLLGYFRAREGEKAWRIVREARTIEWEYVPSEFAALLRELELIKCFRPPHNVHRKRDRAFAYLKITPGPAPKLQVVRRVGGRGRYFGPLRARREMVEAVRELNDALLLRDCRSGTPIHFSDQRDLFEVNRAPLCSRYELRRCLAPCAGLCSAVEYERALTTARQFLAGEVDEPIDRLEARMREAADRLEFEHAAGLRMRISRLESLRTEFLRLRAALTDLSFLYLVPGVDGDHRIYVIRTGTIRAEYAVPRNREERTALLERAAQHFREPEPLGKVTSRHRPEQILLVSHWFGTRPEERAMTFTRDRWDELPILAQLDAEVSA